MLPAAEAFKYHYGEGFCSILMLGLVDAGHKLIYVDFGAHMKLTGDNVFKETALFAALDQGKSGIPPARSLPHDLVSVGFHVVADDGFALRDWLMKPYARDVRLGRSSFSTTDFPGPGAG